MSAKLLSNLLSEMSAFEKQYIYSENIHQVTIDIVESITIDYNDYIYSSYFEFLSKDFIGSCLYKVENLIEVCDKNIYDYEVLLKLKSLLETYV